MRFSRYNTGTVIPKAGCHRYRTSARSTWAEWNWTVVGRKNHLGSKSKRGTEVAAIFYSLIESAKLAGKDPAAYLHAAVAAAIVDKRVLLAHQM